MFLATAPTDEDLRAGDGLPRVGVTVLVLLAAGVAARGVDVTLGLLVVVVVLELVAGLLRDGVVDAHFFSSFLDGTCLAAARELIPPSDARLGSLLTGLPVDPKPAEEGRLAGVTGDDS